MGQIIKPNSLLPYKSLIFNYKNVDISTILFNDTGLNFTILSSASGELTITADQSILQQDFYCVIVTPIRTNTNNNNSINVLNDFNVTNIIKLYNDKNENNVGTDDGFENMTVQINFFNL
jgi:hypothetical protein